MCLIGLLAMFLSLVGGSRADKVEETVEKAMEGLDVRESDIPYSHTIEKIYIGYDAKGKPKVGVSCGEIESFKFLIGIVIVEKTAEGFLLKEALFPDIGKIENAKDRKNVLSILEMFKNIPFDPHVEKSAVDGLTGATRHGIETSGYLNHMARCTALEMEAKTDWPIKPKAPATLP